eukprot:jgi/Astpho2/5300/Aster-05859
MQALTSKTSASMAGTAVQQRQQTGRSMCAQPVRAGPKGRFFDRPAGDKKESERYSKSEVRKKGTLRVPKNAGLNSAWPGKSNKVREARQRGPEGDGRVFKTSNKVQGSTGLPSGTPIVAGAGALLLVVVALLASGGLTPPPPPAPQ